VNLEAGEQTLSVIGGAVWPRRRGPFAKAWASWPFGRLDLDHRGVTLAARGPLERLFPHANFPYGELAFVERVLPPRPLRFAEQLRFHPVAADVRSASFSTWPQGIRRIAEVLESRGVEVR
jgi:hypothetical protein